MNGRGVVRQCAVHCMIEVYYVLGEDDCGQ